MPLCAIYLLALEPQTSIPAFLNLLSSQSPPIKPLVASRVITWIIKPTTIDADALINPPYPWDLLVFLPSTAALPDAVVSKVRNSFSLTSGIPSRLIGQNFHSENAERLHPSDSASIPKATTPSLLDPYSESPPVARDSQHLTLSPSFLYWARHFFKSSPVGTQPVSMLNLLAFRKTEAAHKSYLAYGAAFAKSIGSRHGGNAKLVGNVVQSPSASASSRTSSGPQTPDQSEFPSAALSPNSVPAPQQKWDEIALAQYPSIAHFASMLGSADYQEVNQQYRVPSLYDTCILCTSEIAVEQEIAAERQQSKGKGSRLGRDHDEGVGAGYMAKL